MLNKPSHLWKVMIQKSVLSKNQNLLVNLAACQIQAVVIESFGEIKDSAWDQDCACVLLRLDEVRSLCHHLEAAGIEPDASQRPMIMALRNGEGLATIESCLSMGLDDVIPEGMEPSLLIVKIKLFVEHYSMRAQLRELTRLAEIRELISKYNHDFNNPLTVAMGNLHYAAISSTTDDIQDRIKKASDALKKMAAIIRQFRQINDSLVAWKNT